MGFRIHRGRGSLGHQPHHAEISGGLRISGGLFYGSGLFSVRCVLVVYFFNPDLCVFKGEGPGVSLCSARAIPSGKGITAFKQTFHRIKTFGELTKFLVAFVIYNDGIETVIVMASIFGAEVLGMKTGEAHPLLSNDSGDCFFRVIAFRILGRRHRE